MTTAVSSPKSILVVATRQIGDVLLVTPLLHSLRVAYPKARIDVLGYNNKCIMLKGNDDINAILEISEKPKLDEFLHLFKRIFRKYDLSITTLTGDKPHFYAWLASKYRVGMVASLLGKDLWKRLSCKQWVLFDNENTHTVLQNIKLLECLNISPIIKIIPPVTTNTDLEIPSEQYAVIHPVPMWEYKKWTMQAWLDVINYLLSKGLKVIISGGPSSQDMEFCSALEANFPDADVKNLAGKMQLGELANYIQNAKCYIGIDTSITHMAAATGCPTIAIFGPTNPVKWGAWPANYAETKNPYVEKANPWQQQGNVLLIQNGKMPCVPCHQEGCDKHKKSQSECLQTLKPDVVLRAIDTILSSTK